jgi:hypothetical protein
VAAAAVPATLFTSLTSGDAPQIANGGWCAGGSGPRFLALLDFDVNNPWYTDGWTKVRLNTGLWPVMSVRGDP